MRPLLLSCFPGIDLLGLAFQEVWPEACIVRGPDPIFGSLHDIRSFHPPQSVFHGAFAGPPCQCFSRLRHLVEHNGYTVAENLIPEFERVVGEAQPVWFLMENVPAAPEPVVSGYIVHSLLFNNRWTGAEQNRVRRFSFGTRDGRRLLPDVVAFEAQRFEPAVLAGAGSAICVKIGGSGKIKSTWHVGRMSRVFTESLRLQGLPEDFLSDSPFTVRGKVAAVGNGVPLPMGCAIAKAVRGAMYGEERNSDEHQTTDSPG